MAREGSGSTSSVMSVKVAPSCSSLAGAALDTGCVSLCSRQIRLVGESAWIMPSSRETTPSVMSRAISASKLCEPSASDFSIASLTAVRSPFSISSATSTVFSRTSTAATRPPALARSSRCEITARSPAARSDSSAGRDSGV